jgi:peptide/nickel transport system substrate-binding protein
MKKVIALLLVIVMMMSIFAGCDSNNESTNANNGNANEATETKKDEPKEPAVLTVLMDSNDGWVRNFNPFANGSYQFVNGFMHEHLVLFDTMNNNQEHMWLAEEIISEDDHKTLIVKVRKGVLWSDGEEFNAEDVAFSYTYSKDHPTIDRSGDWGENGKLESVEIVDDYTVKIVMREANRFHRQDIFLQKMIVPEHIWSSIEDPATYVYENPVVTGAFSEVISFTPEMVVLGRNENYWQADKLEVDELRVPQFNGNDGALSLLQSGQVDWAHIFIPNAETNYIQGDANRKFWYGMNDGVRVAFNYMTPNEGNRKAFNSPEFKKAFSLAVDREGIIDSAVFGYLDRTVPPVTGLPPALLGYVDEEAQKIHAEFTQYDLDKAAKLLEDAGFVDGDGDGWVENPDGSLIEFEILSPAGWTDWNDGAAIVAEGLRKIGINATANAVDLGIIIESWESGEHDALYTAYGSSSNIWKFYFDSIGDASRVKTSTWWSTTQTNYINEEINEMIAKMPQASDEELVEMTSYIERFFTENMINVPVLYNGNWFVYNDGRFTGWSTAENPYCQPALSVHDMKVFHLMNLKRVN